MPSSRPVCLYIKCRPQGADILELCRSVERVFIGYPPWRKDAVYSRARSREWLLDLAAHEGPVRSAELHEECGSQGYRSKITFNQNLVRAVAEGSIVVIPRPGSGTLHLGRVGAFELVESPTWIDHYCEIRRRGGLSADPEESHAGDVVQSFPLRSPLQQIPFSAAPRWLSSQALSRTTCGILKSGPAGEPSAFEVAERLLKGEFSQDVRVTLEPAAVHARLLRGLGPAAFEVLVVELLQLSAAPAVRWSHVGGSGDGGADGLGFGSDGRPTAGLTCKFALNEDPSSLGVRLRDGMRDAWGGDAIAYVAWLSGPVTTPAPPDGVAYLDGLEVARRLIEHRHHCAFARMLGVA